MSSTKLKKAPLQEVVFELRWEGERNANGVLYDSGFELAQGVLSQKLKAQFPLRKKLIPEGLSATFFGMPLHQYWSGEFEWPVVQHGPGILTINEIEKGYEWEKTYKPTVIKVINSLCEVYDEPLSFRSAELKYVDAWEMADGENFQEFINKNFLVKMYNEYSLPGTIIGTGLSQRFLLEDNSEIQVDIANGVNDRTGKEAVILNTTIQKAQNFKKRDILEWLEYAHSRTSHIFKEILNPDFYASLDR
ncbi:MAG: TIGR04255 family protein [Bacteroidia bacterium]|nr:TIGR04255 family protein [Bacteroidia bacterium]